jgi:hypothetical protein
MYDIFTIRLQMLCTIYHALMPNRPIGLHLYTPVDKLVAQQLASKVSPVFIPRHVALECMVTPEVSQSNSKKWRSYSLSKLKLWGAVALQLSIWAGGTLACRKALVLGYTLQVLERPTLKTDVRRRSWISVFTVLVRGVAEQLRMFFFFWRLDMSWEPPDPAGIRGDFKIRKVMRVWSFNHSFWPVFGEYLAF